MTPSPDVTTPSRDLSLLAPKFRAAVEASLAVAAAMGLPVKINEGFRSQARQAWLYAEGRTRPGGIVTNAPSALTSWHGYGLAIDFIHATLAFEPFGHDEARNAAWFHEVAAVFKAHGLSAGCDWHHPDLPHIQWGGCPISPTAELREAMEICGCTAVWTKVGAL